MTRRVGDLRQQTETRGDCRRHPVDYADWYTRATSRPDQMDYTAFRFAYAASESFTPIPFDDDGEALDDAMARGDWSAAAAVLDRLLPRGYARAHLHLYAIIVYRALADPRAAHHEAVYDGLIESILQSGQGTPDAPWVVISVEEEYAVLGALRLLSGEQDLLPVGDRQLDCISTVPRDDPSATPVDLHFDVTLAYEALGRVVRKRLNNPPPH